MTSRREDALRGQARNVCHMADADVCFAIYHREGDQCRNLQKPVPEALEGRKIYRKIANTLRAKLERRAGERSRYLVRADAGFVTAGTAYDFVDDEKAENSGRTASPVRTSAHDGSRSTAAGS